ncbi:MAG: carbon-phosphorus lyase complex subunit PhnI, partial [Pseudomonadota bacterium]
MDKSQEPTVNPEPAENAGAAAPEQTPERRFKIGLALGGGVARGWAHIGAIRALRKAGIEPDIVCGTSVGALVGGCYLAGELDALETWARSLTKRRMLGYFDLLLGGSGIIGGKRLEKVMKRYMAGDTIEGLSKPFAAVTAELATGHEIWLQEGDLIEAIFMIRAYRTTLPRIGTTGPVETDRMACDRRISATFKDLPGGQVLGPTFDYTHRLLDFKLAAEGEVPDAPAQAADQSP